MNDSLNNAADSRGQFLALVEDHKGIIYKVAYAYCHNADDRRDLIQEILLQLWRSQAQYNPKYAQSTWVYRIALNVSISAIRKSSRKHRTFVSLDESTLIADSSLSSDSNEELQRLHQLISQLKEFDRALMLLHLDRKSHQDIAQILGITESNVSTRLHRIRKELQSKFHRS